MNELPLNIPKSYWIIPLASIIVSILVSLFLYSLAPPQIPIWYSLTIPEQQLERREAIFLFPFGITVICLLHAGLFTRKGAYDGALLRILIGFSFIPIFLFILGLIRLAVVIL